MVAAKTSDELNRTGINITYCLGWLRTEKSVLIVPASNSETTGL